MDGEVGDPHLRGDDEYILGDDKYILGDDEYILGYDEYIEYGLDNELGIGIDIRRYTSLSA